MSTDGTHGGDSVNKLIASAQQPNVNEMGLTFANNTLINGNFSATDHVKTVNSNKVNTDILIGQGIRLPKK